MSKQTSSNGIGFLGLLALIFIALKLAGIGAVANWSWLWVLSPLWIPTAIGLCVALPIVLWYANQRQWRGR